MKSQLIIIGTTHEEAGTTSVDDLYSILLEISPEVIFEEIPVNLFEKIYVHNELPETIEVKAVRKYSNNHKVDHFPIDMNNLGAISRNLELNKIDEEISTYINKNERNDIMELNTKLCYIDSTGHKNINSKNHYDLYKRVCKLTEQYLAKNNRTLYLKNMIQKNFHFGIREYNMIIEIGKYVKRYNKMVLLIGYYHLESMILKLKKEYKDIEILMYK